MVSCISITYISEISHAAGQENDVIAYCAAVILYRVSDTNLHSNIYQVSGTCHALIFRVDRLFGFIVLHWWQLDDRIRVCCVTADVGTLFGCRFDWGLNFDFWFSGCCDGWLSLIVGCIL